MTTLSNRHMNSDLAHATRAAQRKLKQLEIEKEQRMEEAEALKMTEEQRQILHNSFRSVKVEFCDLDGLSWSKVPQKRVTSSDQTFTVLTNTDLASFGPHDTIRASASSRPHPRTSNSSPTFSSRPFFSPPSTSLALRHARSSMSSREKMIAILHDHKAARSRSPIKGLFSADGYDSDSERTIRGSDSGLDDCSRSKRERKRTCMSKRAGTLRGVSSPSAAMISVSFVAKKLATAVLCKKMAADDPVTQKVDSEESAFAGALAPRTTTYPAYITYSKSSPAKSSRSSPLEPDTQTPTVSFSTTSSKSGSATTALYHLPTSNGD